MFGEGCRGRKREGRQALWACGDVKGIYGNVSLLPSTLFLGIELQSCSKCPLSVEPSPQPDRGPWTVCCSSFHCIDLTPWKRDLKRILFRYIFAVQGYRFFLSSPWQVWQQTPHKLGAWGSVVISKEAIQYQYDHRQNQEVNEGKSSISKFCRWKESFTRHAPHLLNQYR